MGSFFLHQQQWSKSCCKTQNKVVKVRPNKPKIIIVKPNKVKRNYIWVPGHWKWSLRKGRYVWIKGKWKKRKDIVNGYTEDGKKFPEVTYG